MLTYLIAKAHPWDDDPHGNFLRSVGDMNELAGQLRRILREVPGYLRFVGCTGDRIEAFIEVVNSDDMRRVKTAIVERKLVRQAVMQETTEELYRARVPPAGLPVVRARRPSG